MPFDITVYKKIKRLIPNHYVDLLDGTPHRFVNSVERQTNVEVHEVVVRTVPMIAAILKMYLSKYELICPITCGRDSRVVLAFLKSFYMEPFKCYTIQHKGMKTESQDIQIPQELCRMWPLVSMKSYSTKKNLAENMLFFILRPRIFIAWEMPHAVCQ